MEHVNVNLENTPEAVDMDTGKPAVPVVSTFSSIFEIKEPALEKRPSMATKIAKKVEGFIERAASLIAKYQIVEKEHMKRGHKALYEFLANTYDFALDVFNSPHKTEIIDAMRWRIKNETGKMPSATPEMSVIVKYVADDADRQTVHNYSRALRVAFEEDVPVTSLVKYIEDAGGITKITSSKADKAKSKQNQETIAERAELLRRLYVARGALATSPAFIFNEPILQWSIKTAKSKKQDEKESSKETGDFVIMLAVLDEKTQMYRAVEGNDFGATFEMGMFRHMAARITTDVVKMKKKVQDIERAAWGESLEDRRERLLKMEEEEAEKRQKQHDENLEKMRNHPKEAEKSSEPA